MDVRYFLKRRTRFIRRFYETASAPFSETIRKIEAEEAPFDNPPYYEDGEPHYLEEWIEADTGRELVGRSCVSMLAGTLGLFFREWEAALGIVWEPGERAKAWRTGLRAGYLPALGRAVHLPVDDCPADLAVIEQVILARNRDQHPEDIGTLEVRHTESGRKKFPQLFFVSEIERNIYTQPDMQDMYLMNPAVHVSRAQLFAAIDEVEKLAAWFEKCLRASR